jgi:hypothetical protein
MAEELDMTAAPDAIAKARSSGFSDEQIYNYLSQRAPNQFNRARAAGKSQTEILNYIAGPSAQPASEPAPPKPEQPMSWGQVGQQAALNLVPSAGRVVGDVAHSVMHPIETAKNIKDVGLGVMELVGAKEGEGHEKYAQAIGKYFADRYGFGEKGVEGFKKAFAEDPASFLADVAGVAMGGEGILARAPGMARAAEVAGTVGRAIDPLTNVGRVVKGAGYLASEGVGQLTGTGGVPLRIAYEAGQEGGEAGRAFRQNLIGKEPSTGVIQDAKTALGNMREQRGIDYREGMIPVKGDKTVLDWSGVDKSIQDMENVATYKGQVIAPKTEAIRAEIKQVIDHWKGLDPAEYHTPEGFDALKQQIGELRDLTKEGTPDRVVANQAYNAVKNTIVDQAPKYAEVMQGYSDASKLISEIQKSLSLGEKATADTALRKLQSVMRNNVQTNYGRRTDLAKMLAANGAPQLMEKLAGQALSAPMPRGLARLVAGGIEAAPAAAGLVKGGAAMGGLAAAKAAPLLAFTSPLLMGSAAHGLGIASRYAPLSTLPGRVTRIPTAAERMYGPR